MKQKLCRNNLFCAFIVSLSFSVTLILFPASDTVLRNSIEFPVSPGNIIIPIFILSLAISAVVFLFLLICLLINQKLFNSMVCIFFGIILAAYIQLLFFNKEMVLVNEDAQIYIERNLHNYSNFIIYYIILFLPLILYFAKKSYKAAFYKYFTRTNLSIASAIIIAMQTVGICSSIPNIHKFDESQYTEYLSYEPFTSLSKEKNIIIFIFDRMDGQWMQETEKEYPDLYDKLDGFTFYSDNTSLYTQTFPAVPHLLTGKKYTVSNQYTYLKSAWGDAYLPDKLHNNGFKINYALESSTSYGCISNLYGKCDNIKSADCGYTLNYSNYGGIIPTMSMMALSEALPYFMKPVAADSIPTDFTNRFVILNKKPNDKMEYSISSETDKSFSDYIDSHALNADNSSKVFNFVHFIGAHDSTANKTESLYTDFKIVSDYIEQMKKIGVYDNSTIIILGDHGRPPNWESPNGKLTKAITTAILIKPENARGKLQNNSTAQLSHEFFPASILEYAGIDHSEYGYSYNDIITNGLVVTRKLESYEIPENILKAEINGDSTDFSNWNCKYSK